MMEPIPESKSLLLCPLSDCLSGVDQQKKLADTDAGKLIEAVRTVAE